MENLKNILSKPLNSDSKIYNLYHKYLKTMELLKYRLSDKRSNSIIALTFDEPPNENSIRVPKFLNEKEIEATFFVPPDNAEEKYIEETVSLGHEIGGHGWNHGDSEVRNHHQESAFKCFEYLKELYPDIASWRFPGLTASQKGYENIKKAGFRIDSTRGIYYPFQKPKKHLGLKEYPFLRLPPNGQMDIDTESYDAMFDFIIKKLIKLKGVIVLPFHTWYQNDNFTEFKNLINELKNKKLNFKKLIDLESEFR